MKQNYTPKRKNKLVKSKWNYLILLFFSASLLHLSAQQTYTFTSAGVTGSVGPSQLQINTAYGTTNLNGQVLVSGGIQTWTVPTSGLYQIDVYGASGGIAPGYSTRLPGLGSRIQGDFMLNQGDVLQILVGQKGENGVGNAGGGGGTYVVLNNLPLIVAGGGGGVSSDQNGVNGATVTSGTQDNPAVSLGGVNGTGGQACQMGSYSGGAGGGFLLGTTGNGQDGLLGGFGGKSFLNGGTGGACYPAANCPAGGFGGGGGGRTATVGGGGGGGYSGGAGGQHLNVCVSNGSRTGGGGGGSFNSGQNPISVSGANTGDGKVIIKSLCSISLTSSASNSLNPSICSGQSLTLTTNAVSNYSWSTGSTASSLVVSPTTNTVYSLTATSPSNCTASANLTVIVSGGQPTLSVVSSTNQTCLGKTATLTASGAVTYTWTNGVTNGVSFNPQATNTYTVIGENGCGTVQAVSTISILPLPLTVVTSNSVVCTNKTATLSATASATSYTWQPGNVIGASPNLIVNPQTSTNYTVTATDGTCVGVANVSVQADPVPTIQIVASATTACPGDAVTFTASGASSYTWTSLNNQTGANATINPTTTAIYNVIGDNQFGCQSNASQVVQVVTAPNINASTNSPSICAGGSSTLNVTGANSYTWTGGTNGNSVVVNPNQTTVFTVDGSNSGNPCIATRTLEITVFTPSLTISGNTTICDGQTANLTAGAATSYTWAHAPSFPGANVAVSPNTTTTYTVNATHEFNGGQVKCPISGNIQVVVNPNPTVSVVPTRAGMCAKESNTLTGSGASTYTWVSTSTTIAAPEVVISPSNAGFVNYTVSGISSQGCEGSTAYVLNVSACTGVEELNTNNSMVNIYPNPSNGDFTIQASNDMQLKLINQLGQVIEVIQLNEKNNYKTQFNHLSSGVYFITGDNLNKKVIVSK